MSERMTAYYLCISVEELRLAYYITPSDFIKELEKMA